MSWVGCCTVVSAGNICRDSGVSSKPQTASSCGTPTPSTPRVVQAAPGQIPDGAVAYTITGTRHRTGYWGTDPVTTTHPVAFTVFLTCTPERTPAPAPADPITATCLLLRLSQLDNPLR